MATKNRQEIVINRLPNGLTVVSAPTPGARSASVGVFVGAGSRYETPEINGVSHFLEHLFFGGTAKRPTSREISEAIESVGGYLNAYTGEDKTCYYAKVPGAHLERAFDVLTDMVRASRLDPAKIERERGVVIEEINMYQDDPKRLTSELIPEVLWPGQPLGMTILGPREVIGSLSRAEITRYIQSRYLPSNMVVSAAGGVDPDQVTALTERYLADMPAGEVAPALPAREAPGSRVKALRRPGDQTHFIIGVYAPSLTDQRRRATARILNAILGEGMSSRLFLEIREERGLAYYVSSTYEPLVDTGAIMVRAGVNTGKVDEAIRAVGAELERLAGERVSEAEFEKAREYAKGTLQLRLEDSASLSDWMGTLTLLLGQPISPEETLASYDQVTPEAVRDLAAELFDPGRRHMIAIGPEADEERLRSVFVPAEVS